jgi:hypothetical protein
MLIFKKNISGWIVMVFKSISGKMRLGISLAISIAIIFTIVICIFSFGFLEEFDNNEKEDQNGTKNHISENGDSYLLFQGEVIDSTTKEPLDNVQVKVEAVWFIDHGTRVVPAPLPPTERKFLGVTNTSIEGEYILNVTAYENESAIDLHYELGFSKIGYYSVIKTFDEMGQKSKIYFFNCSMDVKVSISGIVRNEMGVPLDNALIIVNTDWTNYYPYFNVYKSATTSKGNFEIHDIRSGTYDIIIGCQKYNTKIIEDMQLSGHVDHFIDTGLPLINQAERNITVNGSIFVIEGSMQESYYLWILDGTGNSIEILNIDNNGNFSVNLPSGDYYFIPFVINNIEWIEWEIFDQPITIYKGILIEIEGWILSP